jgi:acyl carrier protein
MNKEELYEIVKAEVANYCIENDFPIDFSEGRKTRLFGGGGPLDSLGLVSMIVQLEELVEEKTGKSIIIADEKAMSRRTSPFATLGLLSDYIFELLEK